MAEDGQLSEPREWFGHFWPPGQHDGEAKAGHLSYRAQDGLKGKLIGGFVERVLPIVHGQIELVPVTLLDSVATSTRQQMFGSIIAQEIQPQILLHGISLNDSAEQCFKGLEIEIENLTRWSAYQDMTLEIEYDDKLPPPVPESTFRRTVRKVFPRLLKERAQPVPPAPTGYARWAVEGKPVDHRQAQINGLTVELRRANYLPHWDEYRDRTVGRIAARSFLRFSSTASRTAEEWEEVGRLAQDLLSLATFTPCALLRQTLIPDDAKRESDATARSEVHLFAKQLVAGAPDEPAMDPWEMLFNLSDIDFETLLPDWSKVRDMLRPTCNMVLGLKYIPEGYVETKLLTVAGAAEVMEGSLSRGQDRPLPVPKDRYRTLRKELLCLAPAEYRDWLDKKLYNAPSLQDKLKLIAALLDTQVTAVLLPNADLWAQRTTYARNDLAHRGQSTRVSALEMSAIVDVTVAVIIVCLLTQLEIPTSRILQALERHPDLKYAPGLAEKYWPASD